MSKSFHILTALFAVLFFYSCSKEESFEINNNNNPGNPSTGLLVKTVANFGLDSTIVLYAYDAQKRMTRQIITSQDPNFINEDRRIVRAADGHIQQVVYRSDEYVMIGVDSVVYNVYYNGTSYTHKILQFEDRSGVEHKDSTAYTYDAQNRIIKEEEFSYDPVGGTYIADTKADYSYDGSGIVKVDISHFDTDINNYQLVSQTTAEYDDKESPLSLGNEGIVIDQYHLWNSHNPTKESVVYPDEPSENTASSATYTYNDKNKPMVATVTEANSGLSFIITFYYQ